MHDPTTYVKDWTVGRPMRRETGKITIFEYACHEGNYAMEGILAGARLQDKEPRRRSSNRRRGAPLVRGSRRYVMPASHSAVSSHRSRTP